MVICIFFLSVINFEYAHPTFTNHPVNAWKCCLNIMCEFHQRYPLGKEGRETLVISCHGIDAKLVLRQTMWKFHQITLDDECRRRKGGGVHVFLMPRNNRKMLPMAVVAIRSIEINMTGVLKMKNVLDL